MMSSLKSCKFPIKFINGFLEGALIYSVLIRQCEGRTETIDGKDEEGGSEWCLGGGKKGGSCTSHAMGSRVYPLT